MSMFYSARLYLKEASHKVVFNTCTCTCVGVYLNTEGKVKAKVIMT